MDTSGLQSSNSHHRDENGNVSIVREFSASLTGLRSSNLQDDCDNCDSSRKIKNKTQAPNQSQRSWDIKEVTQQESSRVTSQPRGRIKRSLSKHDVPQLFHPSHTELGFRPMHQPWSYYFWSIFSLHNESLNVWTHLIPLILIIRKTLTFSAELDFVSDPYTWPLLTGLLSGTIVFFCSSVAHCYHSKSEFIHHLFFMFDYFGIAQYSLGCGIIHLYYSSGDDFYRRVQPFFLPAAVILPTVICYCLIITKVKPGFHGIKTKVYKMVPITFTYILFNIPVFDRLIRCYYGGRECDPSIDKHLLQVVSFAVSGFFFGSDIPQKWSPGKYDYFLHSHQLFHVAIALCILVKMDAVKLDFTLREAEIRQRPVNDYVGVILPYFAVLITGICCVIYYAAETYQRLQREDTKKKKVPTATLR